MIGEVGIQMESVESEKRCRHENKQSLYYLGGFAGGARIGG